MTKLIPALIATLLLAGCGSSDKETPAAKKTPTASAPKTISTDLTEEPGVPKQTAPPPSGLVTKDIVKGKGKKAFIGDQLSVQYTGVLYDTGAKFDASWDRNAEPFQFQVGAGGVIPGWDRGIPGMRVGGRRELIVPPALAYGDQATPDIPAGSTLIFIIDLVKIG